MSATLDDVMAELREVRRLLAELPVPASAPAPRDPTRPISAAELCERWEVRAPTDRLRLTYLRRLCRERGLRPMKGSKGWSATFRLTDVLRAEERATKGGYGS